MIANMPAPAGLPAPIRAPGMAEIKPDNGPAIRDGLNQLRAYLRQSDASRRAGPGSRAARPAWMSGTEPQRDSVWLVTYRPWPPGPAPSQVRIFAHDIARDKLVARSTRDDRLPATKDLVKSRRELPPVPLAKTIPFPSPERQPDMFGLAVEDLVRQQFGRIYKRANYRGRRPGRKGPDVLWRELGDLFHELALETGDGYWHEVADELGHGV
ncbi:hypothetical protein [Pseudarthrobacter sp. C4D7]|uniref:hypothetical protein n=1 Tax=Pseudarthrobacter sp. C4D7 TaxID=2735268 RepID=UPI001585AA34|nr:hypothetical protein [Pseudarthrobacter sp. C4D7]NUT71256.1 hypothetical protein [Pseudarthrobacter sp. C4D7]